MPNVRISTPKDFQIEHSGLRVVLYLNLGIVTIVSDAYFTYQQQLLCACPTASDYN